MNTIPIVRDICLVGGGHSHALVLRRWAMKPIPGIRLTLVSSAVQTPYSGMLPGLIAGHYGYDDIHIDLQRLCSWAGVRFIEDTVTALDLDARNVQFAKRPALGFDVLSLDTGSTPDLSVPGSSEHVVPVKPVSNFHARWQNLRQRLESSSNRKVAIGIVGSGAGGFELVTAMKYQLKDTPARCYWFLRSDDAIQGRAEKVGLFAQEAAMAAGIKVVRGFDVVEVKAGRLISADKREVSLDEIIWCTAATGPHWPGAAGLDTDSRGFVATRGTLQSTSHDFVFATGDIGTQVDTPSTKAGVFAVRQAPVLYNNLRAYCLGETLRIYKPQKDFLSLMATGPEHGIASRGPLVVRGKWVWRWKDHIDQTFMNRFRHLPERKMNALDKLPDALLKGSALSDTTDMSSATVSKVSGNNRYRCKGCGAKVGQRSLQRVLDELLLQPVSGSRALAAASPAGDTAIVNLPTRVLVQSVDQINAIVDDPYLLGRIAALHAMSDVFTQNAELHSAQAILTVPEATPDIAERDLRLLMRGILSALDEASCALIGGHTTQGSEMSVALAINATLRSESTASESVPTIREGDVLILTKALGIGVLFAGLMQTRARGKDIMGAVDTMLVSNHVAADVLRQHGASAMTDITGFGLAGHLNRLLHGLELVVDTGVLDAGAVLSLSRIPFLDGALELGRQGCKSSLWSENAVSLSTAIIDKEAEAAAVALLADPQTSGGLLAVIPETSAHDCLIALKEAGYESAACIGTVKASPTLSITQ